MGNNFGLKKYSFFVNISLLMSFFQLILSSGSISIICLNNFVTYSNYPCYCKFNIIECERANLTIFVDLY